MKRAGARKNSTGSGSSAGTTTTNNTTTTQKLIEEAKMMLSKENEMLGKTVEQLQLENQMLKQQIDQLIMGLGATESSTEVDKRSGPKPSQGTKKKMINQNVLTDIVGLTEQQVMHNYEQEISRLKFKVRMLEAELTMTKTTQSLKEQQQSNDELISNENQQQTVAVGTNKDKIKIDYVHEEFLDLKNECDRRIATLKENLKALRSYHEN